MKMIRCLLLYVLLSSGALAQVKLCVWNIQNFAKSKSDSEMVFIAYTLRDSDVVAVVDAVAGNGRAVAVSRLAGELTRKGAKWDYVVSDPTSSAGTGGSERYAYLWKTARLRKLGDAKLDTNYHMEIEREPYFASFSSG